MKGKGKHGSRKALEGKSEVDKIMVTWMGQEYGQHPVAFRVLQLMMSGDPEDEKRAVFMLKEIFQEANESRSGNFFRGLATVIEAYQFKGRECIGREKTKAESIRYYLAWNYLFQKKAIPPLADLADEMSFKGIATDEREIRRALGDLKG